ncbi:MAG: hypothetical protein EP330_14975 [Deltaproteobacteria bacterium]|nr:MAG: hypothetical protein EP330_14975 [Deltaproteobacteria bacterium]
MLGLALLLPAVWAAGHVTCGEQPTSGCYATLQDAIDAAADGDQITVTTGTYPESVIITGKSLWLVGTPTLIAGSGESSRPVIDVVNGAVTLHSLTVASLVQRPLRAVDSVVTVETSGIYGGGIQLRGGVADLTRSSLTLDRSTIRGGKALLGGLVYAEESTLSLRSSSLLEGDASTEGGAVYLDGGSTMSAGGPGNVVRDNSAERGAGAIHAEPGSSVSLRDTLLSNNASPNASALRSYGTTELTRVEILHSTETSSVLEFASQATLTEVRLCGHDTSSAPIVLSTGADLTMTHSQLFLNEGPTAAIRADSGSTTDARLIHNTIAHNTSDRGQVLYFGGTGAIELTANLIAHNGVENLADQPPLYGAGNVPVLSRNLLYANDGSPIMAEWLTDGVRDNPAFYPGEFSDCEATAGRYRSWGGAVDAGPEDELDPDGSRADIGAAGGPDAQAVWWQDADADNAPMLVDCDDGNPTYHPAANDTPYNGFDENCDGADDFDLDGDGWAGAENVEDADDCNDGDPTINPGAYDDATDTIDQDCDGEPNKDGDGDGYDAMFPHGGDDCDDTDPSIHPGVADTDPLVDRNCDGVRDIQGRVTPRACNGGAASLFLVPLWFLGRRRRDR